MSGAFDEELRAGIRAPYLIRRGLRGWLGTLGWPEMEAGDLILAVSEAVSNVVEHAYEAGRPGTVRVRAERSVEAEKSARVVVTVTDRGRWHEPSTGPTNRRRGIPMMRAIADSVDVLGGADGTRVRLVSRPVPIGPPVSLPC
jgi:anti-sigma regulatory factor (Ser/Thr protein kinase)